jgi:hypothetical protein
MNYSDWQIEKWSTPVSELENLFMASLVDDGRLEIILTGGDSDAVPKYRFTFNSFPAYRNIIEEYRTVLWTHLDNTKQRCGWTYTVKSSPWIRSLKQSEWLLSANYPVLCHWVIATWDDVVEVLAPEPPTIETF